MVVSNTNLVDSSRSPIFRGKLAVSFREDKITPLKTNMDTQNDALEKVTGPF